MNPIRAGLVFLAALSLAANRPSASADNTGKNTGNSTRAVPGTFPHAMHGAMHSQIVARDGKGSRVVSPMDFGAVGNGVADDYPALRRAADYAFANGLPLDGGDRLYGTSENSFLITGRTRPHIQRLRLKQLAPEADTVTLGFENCEQIRIDSLYIHTGNRPGVGTMESAYGLRVVGGTGHRKERTH